MFLPVTDSSTPIDTPPRTHYHSAESHPMALAIDSREVAKVTILDLTGRIVLGDEIDQLRTAVRNLLAAGKNRIVLNLAEVTMIDSSGIGLLVRFMATAKQRGGNIKLVQPSKFAIQTLRLVGVLNLFEIFDSDDAAVESFA